MKQMCVPDFAVMVRVGRREEPGRLLGGCLHEAEVTSPMCLRGSLQGRWDVELTGQLHASGAETPGGATVLVYISP